MVIRSEWATTLADLVERRLMLLYHQRLTNACLHDLAELLARVDCWATRIATPRSTPRSPACATATASGSRSRQRPLARGPFLQSHLHHGPRHMAKKYILALDQGTTSSRAIVFDHDGTSLAAAQQEFEQILPAPGHVEHDPEAIWSSQLAVATAGARRTPGSRLPTSRPSASPISARRRSSGTAPPARPSPTPSSGKAASARRSATG